MDTEDMRLRFDSLLRRAGLSGVPRPVLACFAALCLAFAALALWQFWPQEPVARDGGFELQVAEQGSSDSAEPQGAADASGRIKVDVEGCVASPGVYELVADARAADAVTAAGGMTGSAAPAGINLAQRLNDGAQLYVPSKKEAKASASAAPAASGFSPASTSSAASAESKVDLNAASAEQLQTLPGIGAALSQAIVDYRTQNGPFGNISDLKKVPGIGDVRFAQVKDLVCV